MKIFKTNREIDNILSGNIKYLTLEFTRPFVEEGDRIDFIDENGNQVGSATLRGYIDGDKNKVWEMIKDFCFLSKAEFFARDYSSKI